MALRCIYILRVKLRVVAFVLLFVACISYVFGSLRCISIASPLRLCCFTLRVYILRVQLRVVVFTLHFRCVFCAGYCVVIRCVYSIIQISLFLCQCVIGLEANSKQDGPDTRRIEGSEGIHANTIVNNECNSHYQVHHLDLASSASAGNSFSFFGLPL